MIPVKVLAVRCLDNASAELARELGAPEGHRCFAMLTTDCDDATYIALDGATKAAEVEVCYGRSFYAGAGNASMPNTGEVIGILAAKTPADARAGLETAMAILKRVGFQDAAGVAYLAQTVASTGRFLSKEAGVPVGSALAYLIAPPLEAMYGLDRAMKAADVKLCKLYTPPTETNFAGALLTGTQSACEAACGAFSAAVTEAAIEPMKW